jgi:hypothetical protein
MLRNMAGRDRDVPAESAAAILAVVLDASGRVRDRVDAPAGTHDFDVQLADGSVIAVEVTRIIRGAQRAQAIAEPGWFADALRMDWFLVLRDDHVKVNGIRAGVQAALSVAESTMTGTPFSPRVHGERVKFVPLDPLPDALTGLGIVAALYLPADRGIPGYVRLSVQPKAFAPMEDALAEIAERVATKAKTLARAVADQRHVFVWVDRPHPTAGTWLCSDAVPTQPLTVPAGVDAVWIAPVHGMSTLTATFADRVWCYRPAEGWSVQVRWLDFWRALDMRRHVRLPPDPDSPSTADRYRPI